jgi:hypothetical protein
METIKRILAAEAGNYFAVFGIEVKEHTRAEIRAVFRRLALQVHPDKIKVGIFEIEVVRVLLPGLCMHAPYLFSGLAFTRVAVHSIFAGQWS